jgi:cellulase
LNLEVTGDGTTVPEGVAGTSIYKADEDGIIFNVYAQDIKYNIPGPALFGAGSGSAPSTPATPTKPATPSKAPSAAPSAVPATPSAAPSTPSAAPSTGNGDLPEEFTIATFISWLEEKASSASNKARRHARSF